MISQASKFLLLGTAAALLAACGGGGGATSTTPVPVSQPQNGNVSMLVSDASTEDWATIGVKVLSIALVPQGGGSNVSVYTAPATVPTINLAQLDQLGEILGNVSVPVGTYTSAVLTISGNPGDVRSSPCGGSGGGIHRHRRRGIPKLDPDPAYPRYGAQPDGSGEGQLRVPAGGEREPEQPARPGIRPRPSGADRRPRAAAAGTVIWAVNFDGPVRHLPLYDITRLVLRHMYGDVTAIASDNTSITITKEFPTEPAVSPETPVASTQSLQILADATNGTIFYDVDAKTRTVIKDFSTEPTLVGKSVRIAARYQSNGTLVATRIWASSTFNSVWVSPEGHVLHVNAGTDVVTVANEAGRPVNLTVDANTQFFFRTPQNGLADATPIGTGTGFLTSHDLVRGFKVHASVVDPLATPLVAQTIDIETATYDGRISAPGPASFTYTRNFATASDDYVYTIDYLAGASANGKDSSGNPITGYKWWNFAYPTLLDSGTNAVSDFVAATSGTTVNFGGTVGALAVNGASYAVWNDPANPNGWAAAATVLTPSSVPLASVATGLGSNDQFTITVTGGTTAATVAVSTTAGSATLVYQVDRTNGVVTVSTIDITTASGLATLTAGLTAGAPVKVYGVPTPAGTIKAYVVTYFTGMAPAQ